MSVINRILNLMEKENINARKLTTDLGLSNSCITEWKKGKAKPSIEAVVKIASYFGVTTDFLLLDGIAECKDETLADVEAAEENSILAKNASEASELKSGSGMRRSYREHLSFYSEGAQNAAELTGEDRKLLDCYHRLDESDREYIRCKMIVLEREAMD